MLNELCFKVICKYLWKIKVLFGTAELQNMGSRKKSSSLNGRAIKRVKGQAIKEKITFLEPFFPTFQSSNVPTAIKHEGGGGVRT